MKPNKEETHLFYRGMLALGIDRLNKHNLSNEVRPLAFAANLENDTPKFNKAMNGPHADKYYHAMESEMKTLEDIQP